MLNFKGNHNCFLPEDVRLLTSSKETVILKQMGSQSRLQLTELSFVVFFVCLFVLRGGRCLIDYLMKEHCSNLVMKK